MSYTFTANRGTALSATVPTTAPVAGQTLTVQFSYNRDFRNIASSKSVSGTGSFVTIALTASEVDALKSTYFRIVGVNGGVTTYLQTGEMDYLVPDAATALQADVVTVSTTGSNSVDTASVQAAINANPGKTIFIDGDQALTLSDSLTITTDRTSLDGNVTLMPGFTNKPMVLIVDSDYNTVGEGLFFDGNWASGVAALELRGALLGKFNVKGDRLQLGVYLNSNTSTQNCAMNHLWVTIRNGVTGLRFRGRSGVHTANNWVHRFEWWSAGSGTPVGVDFVEYADNNHILGGYIFLNVSGARGIVYNSGNPTGDVEVYENHTDAIIEANTAGTVAVKGNRTWQNVGQWPTFARLRLSGSSTPTLDIAANSDIVLVDTNLNGTTAGLRGEDQVSVPPGLITVQAVATSSAFFGFTTWSMPATGTSAINFHAGVPAHWRSFDVYALWAPAGTAGGNVRFQAAHNTYSVGEVLGDVAAVTAVTAAAGTTQNALKETVVASALANVGPFIWGRLSRLGDDGADTATDAARLVGISLRRRL